MKKYLGLFLVLLACILSIYGLTERKYALYNSFLLAVNLCFSVFWIKEIFKEN